MEFFRILAGRRSVHSAGNRRYSIRTAHRSVLICLLAATAIQLVGCKKHDGGASAELRLIDAIPDSPTVRFKLATQSPVLDSTYGTITDPVEAPVGDWLIEAMSKHEGRWTADIEPIKCTIEHDKRYLAVAAGRTGSSPDARILLFSDNLPDEISGNSAEVQVINAYPGASKVDFIINNVVLIGSLPFGDRSKPVELGSNAYQCKVLVSGDYDNPLIGPVPLKIEGGQSYQVVVTDPQNGKQPGIVVLADN